MYLLPISTLCTSFLNKVLFYSPNHDNTSLHYSTFIHHGTSIHSPRRWRLLHLEVVTRLLHNGTSIHTPRRWDIPHSEATTRFLRCWDLPHSEKCLYVPLVGFFPLRDVNADMSTGFFSIVLRESKPSVVRFPPLRVPHYTAGIFPSRAPVCCSADGISPIQNTNTSLWALLA